MVLCSQHVHTKSFLVLPSNNKVYKMVRKWEECDRTVTFVLLGIFSLLFATLPANAQLRTTDITIRKEPGVCQSTDIRNSVSSFSQLQGCQVVEGFVQIVLIDNANETDYANISFPELREITGYLLLYRVNGLRSLGRIFPNLAVIRGNTLFLNYGLVIFEMLHLQEVGLVSLSDIVRGAVLIAKNPLLCFVDTIDWDLITHSGQIGHYISGNKPQNECPMCPSSEHTCPIHSATGGPLCWNSQHCQKVCPTHCNGSCNNNGECCPTTCLGGCSGTLSSYQCVACKNFQFQKKCVKKCPSNTYEYLNRRCVLESECYDLPRPREVNSYNIRNNPWKPFKGQCILECPTGFLEVMEVSSNGEKSYKCEACKGVCKKECAGLNVDSIAAAQELRGCTIIKGALEIQIRGGSNVVKELEENLNMIEEIDEYLKIVRSFPIVSLNFLKNLKVIHGKHLESNKYALVVLDNQNLIELWDWETRKQEFHIGGNGRLFFHFNPKLCLSKIRKLKDVAGLPEYNELEVASNSNGDKVACNVKELNVTVFKTTAEAALIKWNQFEHHDSRTLLGYVVYSIEAPYQNVTIYDGRDACGGDGWRVDDVSASDGSYRENGTNEVVHIVTRLKPFTQYAFYVKSYTIATEKSGAQSRIVYFRTQPSTPSEPRHLTAYSNSSSELVINWQPPSRPNGNLTHYIITGYWERDSEDFTAQRNYCEEPIPSPPEPKIITAKPKHEEIDEETKALNTNLQMCPCKQAVPLDKQREKEIHLEDHLQNQIYVKRNISRKKRDLAEKAALLNKSEELSESHSFVDGAQFTKIVSGTTLVMKNLHHFAHYNIAVRACRKWEEGESNTTNNNCSKEAIVTARTLFLDTADNLDSHYPYLEISNKSSGQVTLKWGEPKLPNSLIVSYEIEYKRSDIENFKPTVICITRRQYLESGSSYHLKKLGPGNYSIRVRASSLARTGDWTSPKYFLIEEDYSVSPYFVVAAVSFLTMTLVLSAMAFFSIRRKYSQVPNSKLIASVNPEYVPTGTVFLVYEPDDWEVSRNRVELLGEIGQGSFGMVYEGRLYTTDGKSMQFCAVKTVNFQAADRDRIEFLNEASVMKAFNTHHVVKLLGVVSQGQPTLVIMELMKRGDLKSYLRSHRPDIVDNPNTNPPSLKRILRMAAEIADGMAYLAAKKFVHRDLAARNCMVAEDLTVKIGDFGMTRDIYETEYYRKGNKGSKGLLPVRWMAPESLKDGIFTTHSDAWSYGIVLYEMVTLASQPYQGLSNDQVLRYVIEGGIMDRPENCPDKLYSIMRLCWENKPSSRPAFIEIVSMLHNDVDTDFEKVSFYHSEEGIEHRAQISSEDTPLRLTREIEDFSLSEDEDYKEPRSNPSSKATSNGSTTPNGYVPQQIVTTIC